MPGNPDSLSRGSIDVSAASRVGGNAVSDPGDSLRALGAFVLAAQEKEQRANTLGLAARLAINATKPPQGSQFARVRKSLS